MLNTKGLKRKTVQRFQNNTGNTKAVIQNGNDHNPWRQQSQQRQRKGATAICAVRLRLANLRHKVQLVQVAYHTSSLAVLSSWVKPQVKIYYRSMIYTLLESIHEKCRDIWCIQRNLTSADLILWQTRVKNQNILYIIKACEKICRTAEYCRNSRSGCKKGAVVAWWEVPGVFPVIRGFKTHNSRVYKVEVDCDSAMNFEGYHIRKQFLIRFANSFGLCIA